MVGSVERVVGGDRPGRDRCAGAVAAAATAANPSVSLGLVRWGNIIGSPASLQGQTIAQDPFRGEGAKVGKGCDSSCYLYRSVWDFSIGALGGRHVLNATFAATLYHSWSCSDTPVELWNVGGGISDSYAWNRLGWPTYLDTRWGHANDSQCRGGPGTPDWSSISRLPTMLSGVRSRWRHVRPSRRTPAG